MKILVIDTCTLQSAVGLVDKGKVIAEKYAQEGISHSEQLFEHIPQLLQKAGWNPYDLEMIAVTHGPGSFTGLRIGIAAAKGIAFALNLPLVGVSSLEALHLNKRVPPAITVPLLDAKRGEMYGRLKDEEMVLSPETWKQEIEKISGKKILLGSGALVYADFFHAELKDCTIPSEDCHTPFVSSIAHLAERDLARNPIPDEVMPHYLRISDAEIGLQKKKKLSIHP
ncbi:MAG: tRNA (adenosine(37)-N6)-threonylcarbamoyltransferase complex dimerization subunit type 1 TsaB [Deltaproteobacteria bacterium RIFCSPLOWO2_02_FULL_44_10]|nr:MAG: tRNA (adenosine(37)-N6)-threonylcarbamoyltransferase complex dimerization subunit type 1 TsaB [Deltaproteobacteria bacterium RIFCSPHIGHO2_02_FULL_44_16]OGQ46405.1 MAG: tRNA (adenosine(37)-N6)-threonylcarbamoyltransferase complex dimerization subunit type 1 TsaB [Deltaproteobacteria bacterium RIFCSPLOWO2_02_FULL_44_10]